ncbi:hypothetical protein [Spirosoma luteum]|uniref:hypothetical protein n=1 Tax=Spirosoma luteum TaxID=431553 RepID=UPI000362C8CE|nr:hypothetical protein [Spirosoma luteum]
MNGIQITDFSTNIPDYDFPIVLSGKEIVDRSKTVNEIAYWLVLSQSQHSIGMPKRPVV